MRLFKVTTTIRKPVEHLDRKSEFVDWYEADTQDQARELWAEDCHRYGLPTDSEATWVECDPITLKPL